MCFVGVRNGKGHELHRKKPDVKWHLRMQIVFVSMVT